MEVARRWRHDGGRCIGRRCGIPLCVPHLGLAEATGLVMGLSVAEAGTRSGENDDDEDMDKADPAA
jgi:hypothetical protein